MKDKVDLLNGQRRRERVGLVDSMFVAMVLALASMMALCHCGGAPFTALDSVTLTDAALADVAPASDDAAADSETSGDDAARGGGQDAGDADPPSKDADAQGCDGMFYSHDDGIGQKWTDCAPPGSASEAMQACLHAAQANGGDPSSCVAVDCDDAGASFDVCGDVGAGQGCACWGYSGLGAGHVMSTGTSACTCATGANWPWG